MKIIIDENVPHPLLRHLSHHQVTSVQHEGWAGIQNGALLQRIDGRFDVFILGDKNLRYQQSNRSFPPSLQRWIQPNRAVMSSFNPDSKQLRVAFPFLIPSSW